MATSVNFKDGFKDDIGVTEEVAQKTFVEKEGLTNNKSKRMLKKESSVRRADGTWSEKQPSWLRIKEIETQRREILKRVSIKEC